jgi:hypothetical protein
VPKLWLGVNRRGAMTDNGIAQMIRKRGAEAGIKGLHPSACFWGLTAVGAGR